MSSKTVFNNLAIVDENPNMLAFQLTDTNVAYANTLRRMVLTGVESVGFRSDMNDKGETSDVTVLVNTTPMTNEMLADRIGLIPVHATPDGWKKEDYQFELDITNDTDKTLPVTASDFTVRKKGAVRRQNIRIGGSNENNQNLENEENDNFGDQANSNPDNNNNQNNNQNNNNNNQNNNDETTYEEPATAVANKEFFHPNPKTGDTCLIALLKAKQPNQAGQRIHLIASASVGTGRQHIRFSPVCQCSYWYTIDTDEGRQQMKFEKWLESYKNKKVADLKEATTADGKPVLEILMKEFQTMEVQRCYKMNEQTGEPNSFDFVIESVGIETVEKIVERALRNIKAKCANYAKIDIERPKNLRVQPADARMKGFDFIFQNEDHTLGNLLQTYMDEHMMGTDVTFVGYKVPHPLRDEMVLRVGVDFPFDEQKDGKDTAALEAVAKAATACASMFDQWLNEWTTVIRGNRLRRNLASLRPTATTQRDVENAANMAKQLANRAKQPATKV